MRHVFIINPAAGKTQGACARVPEIEAFFAANKEFGTPEIVYTEEPGHATRIAKEHAERGDAVRLYACGGDGTVSEVLQGMYRYPNAQLAIFPCGSANDYVRTFPEYDFTNIEALVSGDTHDVDLIRCGNQVSLNIACIGMDADVASKMAKYKHWPLVTGPMAYNIAIADVFFHRIGKDLTIKIQSLEGEIKRRGRYFFALAASGQYYGGGYHGAPMSRPDDGLLDFILIKAMSRAAVLPFLKQYKKGEFLDHRCAEHFRGTSMQVLCDEGAVIALDGECFTDTDITFDLYDTPLAFVLPQRAVVKQPVYSNSVAVKHAAKQASGAFVKKL